MHNRTLFFAVAALGSASFVSSFTGCSSSSSNNNNNNNNTQDSGTASDTGTTVDTGTGGDDSSTPTEAGGDGGLCSTGVAPSGTPILSSSNASVQGVIGNTTVLFLDDQAHTLNSVPIAGGTPTTVLSYDNSGLFISGNVALWSQAPVAASASAPSYGPWLTSVGGAAGKTLAPQAYLGTVGGGYLDVSSDSSLILYVTTTATAPTVANIVVSAPDGTGAVTLVPNVTYTSSSNGTLCAPNARFVGNSVIAAYCTGTPTTQLEATIAQFPVTGGSPTQTFTTAGFFGFSIDNPKTPTQIAYVTANGEYVQALTPVNSTPKLIDKDGVGGAFFTPDGATLIYQQFVPSDAGTGSIGYYRSTIASPSPQKIVDGDYNPLYLSPDGNWLVTYQNVSSNGETTDLQLLSTAAGSTAQTLCPTTTGAIFGDAFTVDDTQALFFCNVGSGVGDFDAVKLMAGATVTTVAKASVWDEAALSAAKVSYNNNWTQPASNKVFGYADIQAQDLSTTAAATTIVSHADANYYLTADRTKLIYSFSACPSSGTPGIYVISAPNP
jgi:hypothetical protein